MSSRWGGNFSPDTDVELGMRSIALCILSILVTPLTGCGYSIAKSHIDGNVPAPEEFAALMKRDVKAYLESEGHRANPKITLLRDGPTQTGIAYPKYYVWIQTDGRQPIQGAMRLSAVNKERFLVSDFMPLSEIQKAPDEVAKVFPKSVAKKILTLAGASN